MLELEKFGLVEMSLEEKKEVDGGIFGLDDIVLLVVGAVIGGLLSQDTGKLADAYAAGQAAGRRK